jgi:DNA mismatch repair ATPase MutS
MTNAIITGPNAGGKSTLIKMMCSNILLSQTVCVTSSAYTELTPFYFVNTQINIPDTKGVESLFEAEMNRCLYNLNFIKKNQTRPCIIFMDEIFNSTNMIEAISGAYSILDKLSQYTNVMTIITTHFTYLTKLKKTSNFECYRMNAILNDGDISYPYILSPGVSNQFIALELLRKRGFDASIIDYATRIKNKFVKQK